MCRALCCCYCATREAFSGDAPFPLSFIVFYRVFFPFEGKSIHGTLVLALLRYLLFSASHPTSEPCPGSWKKAELKAFRNYLIISRYIVNESTKGL